MTVEHGVPAETLHRVPLLPAAQDSPISLVRHLWAVGEATTIGDLAEQLRSREEIPVLALVDDRGTLKGMVRKVHFFAALGRPYGWDVLRRKPVADLLEPVTTFSCDDNLLLLTERLTLEESDQSFYAVVGPGHRFGGFFSPQDLLVWLSRNTQRDLATAKTLQDQLVRRDWTHDGSGVWAQGFCEMFKGVGGDFSTLRSPSPGRWFGCVCDVSGKGIAASLVTTLLWGLLEEIDLNLPLPTVLERLNSAVGKAFRSEKFISGFFWNYDEADGTLTYADLGHSHEYFWQGGKLWNPGDSPHLPLGIADHLEVTTGSCRLDPGDGVLVYTDGLVENVWKSGCDFPVEGVVREILGDRPVSPQEVIGPLREAMKQFRVVFPLHDDVTVAWFQRTGSPL